MKLFRATIWFLYAVALFWVAFGVMWLFRDSDYRYFYFIMAIGNAIVLALIAYFLNRKFPTARIVGLFVTGANIVLTVMDQVGWFDFAYLIPVVALFILLLKLRFPIAKDKKLR